MKFYSLETPFTFGIYEGKTVREVVSVHHLYINWCILNLEHFFLSEKVLKEIKEVDDRFVVSIDEKNKLAEKLKVWKEREEDKLYYEPPQSYENWLDDEFGDDAATAYWNVD